MPVLHPFAACKTCSATASPSTRKMPEYRCTFGQVHGGFHWAYDSLRGPLLEAVGTLMADGTSEPWHVHVTGHALGAGLATLLAYELACST